MTTEERDFPTLGNLPPWLPEKHCAKWADFRHYLEFTDGDFSRPTGKWIYEWEIRYADLSELPDDIPVPRYVELNKCYVEVPGEETPQFVVQRSWLFTFHSYALRAYAPDREKLIEAVWRERPPRRKEGALAEWLS